ncbi:MAG: hypothetical protein WC310_03950 [Patescibacteria group bacterium]|jgi:heat-inducible transcriptional repressor
MEDRTEKLLTSIVREHIKTAQPVGSSLLVEKYHLDVSPATVRNEMALLEEEGYIAQPHTSAGRVPTEKGYRFYVENFLSTREMKEVDQKKLKEMLKRFADDRRLMLKNIAKDLAEMSGQLVFVGFAPNDAYYTGVSNIFSQPEFIEKGLVYDLGVVVDHLDEAMKKIFDLPETASQIMIGSKNPFGNMCSAVVAKYQTKDGNEILGLLGPMRMDYDANVGMVNFIKEIIK